jgi:hypothetical protein
MCHRRQSNKSLLFLPVIYFVGIFKSPPLQQGVIDVRDSPANSANPLVRAPFALVLKYPGRENGPRGAVVAGASFRLLYVMIILSNDRRKIVRFDVTEHPTAGWLSRQVTEAFP